MQNYLLRRAFFALGSMIEVSLIIFVVFRILLGDPLVAILGVEGYNKMAPRSWPTACPPLSPR